ncbi:MAG TPA: hypothetical protein GXZ28_01455 [Clostridiales bacterium]|jgi:hypothetical protein|nr:hypothetical protein [Clostridiales bacterium]
MKFQQIHKIKTLLLAFILLFPCIEQVQAKESDRATFHFITTRDLYP